MTPAINVAKKAKIKYKVHEYEHDANSSSFGAEAAEKLAVSPHQVFKTLVVSFDNNDFAVAIVPVSGQLNMKSCAKAAGVKKAVMADKKDVQRMTGYVLGGVSPLGQKKRLKTIIDVSAENYTGIFVSAGKRGLDIELSPQDLQKLTNGIFAQISQA